MGCALLGGVLIGLLNAFLILICRIRPFLATLGTVYRQQRRAHLYRRRRRDSLSADGSGVSRPAVGNLGGIPTPVAIVLALWLAARLVTERTLWGKYVRAIGQNSEAARIAGIRDRLTMLGVLVTASALCAVGG